MYEAVLTGGCGGAGLKGGDEEGGGQQNDRQANGSHFLLTTS